MTALWLAALLLAAPGARADAAEASAGAGASATAGSEGYRSAAIFADADWTLPTVDPYVWGNLSASRDSRRLSLVGGVADDLRAGWRANAGAGFSVGRIYDDDSSAAALLLEAGLERRMDAVTAGLGYSLTAGGLGGPAAAPAEDRRRRRGKPKGDKDAESETYNELSAFARFPLSKARLTLRLALGLPSYGESVTSETATLRFPVTEPLSLSAGFTLEQSDRTRAYVTVGAYYLFD